MDLPSESSSGMMLALPPAPADRIVYPFQSLAVTGEQQNMGALHCEFLRDRTPDAPARPR